jgi:glycosyltransferase involved in cell wall biosynthesis
VPGAQLWLVGNAPPDGIRALKRDRVRVTGRVPDVVPYLDDATVIACPLRIGGGVKVKALEAVRRGKAVVSSPIGAQGLPAGAVITATDPEQFADAASGLLLDPALRARQQDRARSAACELPSWDGAAGTLAAVDRQVWNGPAVVRAPARRVRAGAAPLNLSAVAGAGGY